MFYYYLIDQNKFRVIAIKENLIIHARKKNFSSELKQVHYVKNLFYINVFHRCFLNMRNDISDKLF